MRSWSLVLQNKSELRKKFRTLLAAYDPKFRMISAALAAQQFSVSPFFTACQHIACYAALPAEFDTTPLIEAIWQAKKTCYLPVLTNKNLNFVRYEKNTALIKNHYQIPEPVAKNIFPLEQLDCVFLPLVAFDRSGYRLGTGGGYYDRAFSQKKSKPLLIGLAYDSQEANQLPHDEWDVKMDGVLTESRLILF